MASPDDLKFQDFEEVAGLLAAAPGASTVPLVTSPPAGDERRGSTGGDVKVELSDDEEGQEESSGLLGGPQPTSGFWTFEYYQSFFNVDTMQVLDRVKGSVMPFPGRNFIKHYLRNNPDLYGIFNCRPTGQMWRAGTFLDNGRNCVPFRESLDALIRPFWICVTLVFSVAISGNLSTFLSKMGDPSYHYRPQFHRVSIAAVVILMYAWLVPLAVWGFLTWRQEAERQIGGYSFLETACVYGYSLFIYIPTSVLWIIPVEWLRWILIVVAMVISGSVLALTFWPVVRNDTKVTAVSTLVTILLLHSLLAVGCKMYFFQTAVHSTSTLVPTLQPTTQVH